MPAASLDGWMRWRLRKLVADVRAAYDGYKTHAAFKLLYEFCNVEISTIYGNAMKDRLYCDAPNGLPRRRCQTVLYETLLAVTKLFAPDVRLHGRRGVGARPAQAGRGGGTVERAPHDAARIVRPAATAGVVDAAGAA